MVLVVEVMAHHHKFHLHMVIINSKLHLRQLAIIVNSRPQDSKLQDSKLLRESTEQLLSPPSLLVSKLPIRRVLAVSRRSNRTSRHFPVFVQSCFLSLKKSSKILKISSSIFMFTFYKTSSLQVAFSLCVFFWTRT